MKKLSKEQKARIESIVKDLREAEGALNGAITMFNDAVAQAEELANEVQQAIEDYIGEKSDRWKESDQGAAYDTWCGEWEGFVSDLSTIDIDIPNVAEELEQLPEEPDTE